MAQRNFSTSSAMEESDGELPDVGVDLDQEIPAMIIGSSSGWLMLQGMMARPRATSSRQIGDSLGMEAPKELPGLRKRSGLRPGAFVSVNSRPMSRGGRCIHLRGDDALAGVVAVG